MTDPTSVHVGICHPDHVGAHFFISFSRFLFHDASNEGYVIRNGSWNSYVSGPLLAQTRNTMVRDFLATDNEWLCLIDSDMSFPPETLGRLLAVADPVERPIVGALCFSYGPTGEMFPTMIVIDEGSKPRRLDDWPRGSLFRVDATGAGFLIVHRRALEAIGKRFGEPYPWFVEETFQGLPTSEDLMFCYRARDCGIPVFVHTGVEVGHQKTIVVTEATYDEWLARRPPKMLIRAKRASEPNYAVVVADAGGAAGLIDQIDRDGGCAHVLVVGLPASENGLDTLAEGRPNVTAVGSTDSLAEAWNLGLERAARMATESDEHSFNVAVLTGSMAIPPGFLTDLARGLRTDDRIAISYPRHDDRDMHSSVVAATIGCDVPGGMCGWAFMVRGEDTWRADVKIEGRLTAADLERRVREAGRLVACVGATSVATAIETNPPAEPERSKSPDGSVRSATAKKKR